jgi:hypothetical protein
MENTTISNQQIESSTPHKLLYKEGTGIQIIREDLREQCAVGGFPIIGKLDRDLYDNHPHAIIMIGHLVTMVDVSAIKILKKS